MRFLLTMTLLLLTLATVAIAAPEPPLSAEEIQLHGERMYREGILPNGQAMQAFVSDDVPVDGVLMQLARAYTLAGKTEDAKKTLKRVIDEFPQSPYAAAARREADGSGA